MKKYLNISYKSQNNKFQFMSLQFLYNLNILPTYAMKDGEETSSEII